MSKKHHSKGPDGENPPPPDESAGQKQSALPDAAASPAEAPAAEVGQPALQAERNDLLARLQRVSADYLNYQKRVQRDVAQAREFANEDLVKALLGVVDDMERALEAARANREADDPLLVGMQMVHDNLLATLGRFGLEPIDAAGKPFDPGLHAAMMQQPTEEHPPGVVIQELQKGYRLKGRTIRPAAVVVSAQPSQTEPE